MAATVLWRLFRTGGANTDRTYAVVLPGGPPHTIAFFANDAMDRVENYETTDLVMFRAEEIKQVLLTDGWKED